MYAADSFFSLSLPGRAGLLCLSLVMAVGLLALSSRVMRGRSTAVRFGVVLVAFVAFVWLSPQVYYTYYQLLFDGLPQQWVIGAPPVGDAMRAATFSGRATLAAHTQGALFWLLVILAARAGGQRR